MENKYIGNKKLFFLNKYLHIIVIIVFEFFGTLIFAYCTFNMVNLKDMSNSIYAKLVYYFLDFSLSMLLVISYGRQFSGGLYNPAVTFFRMFRKTERYSISIGLLYMVCQFSGSIVGCFIAYYVNNISHAPITSILPWYIQLKHIATDALGTMILTFMVQLASEKKMTFIEHNREFYVILPLYYLIARTYSSKSNGVNPAFGVGFELVWCYEYKHWDVFYQTYIFLVGPGLGALIAVILFEFGMRPLFPIKREVIIQTHLKKKQKEQIELKLPISSNNRWTMSQVINQHKYAPIGQEYEFQIIADDQIDDQIDSQDGQEGDEQEQPFATELEREIRKSTIVTNQLMNRRLSEMLARRSTARKNLRQAEEEAVRQAHRRTEKIEDRRIRTVTQMVNYSFLGNLQIKQEEGEGGNAGEQKEGRL